MRLIRRLKDGTLKFTRYLAADALSQHPYAILSHTWLLKNEDEVTYEDFKQGNLKNKPDGYAKIQFCADRAAADGLDYFWVDTCCINKSHSEELQEAITSMFSWYRNSVRCYVYLTDVSIDKSEYSSTTDQLSAHAWEPAFRSSRWFTRGWTLQELLAPASVQFFSIEGIRLGDKETLGPCVYEITGIPIQALYGYDLSRFTVQERLDWSADRDTKRKEDKAYCQLGIFSVFMTQMYGEGEHHALDRLQAEIAKRQAEIDRQDRVLAALPVAVGATHNSQTNEHQPKCLAHTRTELLANVDRWISKSDDRYMCWLNGVAGSGKSTIARTIASHYDYRGRLGANFFFSRGSGDLSNSTKFVTTFARQLATAIPCTRRYICDAVTKHKNIFDQSIREQWNRLVLKPLSELDRALCPSPLLFVIDALDECDHERDIRDMLKLLATVKSLNHLRIKIFISSRPELPIQAGFSNIPELERHTLVLHEEHSSRINRDIRLFFESHFNNIRAERGLLEEWPATDIVEALVKRSGGLFIWASTACRFIKEEIRHPHRRISLLLDGDRSEADSKRQLDQIYSTVIQNSISLQSNTAESLSATLGPIVVLRSTLSVSALAALLDRSLVDVTTTLGSLQSILRLSSQPSAPIRLHHPTFREFLLDRSRCSVLGLWVDERLMHKALADNCVEHMSRELRAYSSESCPSRTNASHIPPALQYACAYWVEHYRRSGIQLCDGDQAHVFFREYFNDWVQVMSMIRKGSEVGALLRLYQSLLTSALNSFQLPLVVGTRQHIARQAASQSRHANSQHGDMSHFLPWNFDLRAPGIDIRSWKDIKEDTNYVNDLVFTPNGTRLASGSNSETVRLWNLETTISIRRLEDDFSEKVSSVCISPDGRLLAAGSDDSTIKVWDLESMEIRHTLKPQAGWVNSVQFAPNGELLASGSMDGKIVMWDTVTGRALREFDNQSRCVNSMSFSPDGSLIATGSDDDYVRLWNVFGQSLEPHQILDGNGQCVNSVKFSSDGMHVLFGSDDATVNLWNLATGKQLTLRGHSKKVTTVAFSPNLRTVASGSEDTTIRIWNASNGASLRTLRAHKSGINAVAYSPTGQLFASGSFDDEVRLWKTGPWTSTVASGSSRGGSPVHQA